MHAHSAAAGLLVVLALVATPLAAQQRGVTAELRSCRSITDSLQRLRCYDGLVPEEAPTSVAGPGGSYARVALVDFKLDRESMRGQLIEVQGRMVIMGEVAMLQTDAMDMSPAFLDITGLPREQRRQVLERCGMGGCEATVLGKVDVTKMMQVGLVGHSVILR